MGAGGPRVNGERDFSAALLDPGRPTPIGLTTWNGSDPTPRFAVYRNNVVLSLIDALADAYPVTQALVGEPFFRGMASIFVRKQPPRSRVLTFYGESFPRFVAAFPPAASLPYLSDVARLEMLRVHAYHAADQLASSSEAIAECLADPESLPEFRVGLQPSAGLLRSRYAVVSLWAAHQGILDISGVETERAENALIIRPQLQVEVLGLDAGDSVFVDHLLRGDCLGTALKQAGQASPGFDATNILALLVRSQAITSLDARRTQP